MSDLLAAFLYAQLENMDQINNRRNEIWDYYLKTLIPLANEGKLRLPYIPPCCLSKSDLFFYPFTGRGHPRCPHAASEKQSHQFRLSLCPLAYVPGREINGLCGRGVAGHGILERAVASSAVLLRDDPGPAADHCRRHFQVFQ